MEFGHHPDPAIDFCTEVDAIEGEMIDRAAGLTPTMDIAARIERAMQFKVGGSASCVVAKSDLRKLDFAFRAGLIAMVAAAPAQHAAMVFVPREPTPEMLFAAWQDASTSFLHADHEEHIASAYRAMVAAASQTAPEAVMLTDDWHRKLMDLVFEFGQIESKNSGEASNEAAAAYRAVAEHARQATTKTVSSRRALT